MHHHSPYDRALGEEALQIQGFEVGPFAVDTYLLWDAQTKQAAIVDPSFGSEGILGHINKEGLTLAYVINTHGHVDHVAADAYFKANVGAVGAQHAAPLPPLLLIHEADLPLLQNSARQAIGFGMRADQAPEPDRFLADGDTITIGGATLTVLHTPGHSPGGICLYSAADGFVLVGDTLFARSIGRTDFPGASHEELINSVRTQLFVLPDDTKVYPGHGPATTIGWEKKYNPFFQEHGSSGLWLP